MSKPEAEPLRPFVKQRILVTFGICVVLLGGILFALHRDWFAHALPGTFPPDHPPGAALSAPPANSGGSTQPAAGNNNRPATPATPGGNPAPEDAIAVTLQDLEKISRMLRDYRTSMGSDPVGTNAEIMKSIMGGNPKKARLGPPEGMSLNANGELVDPWGTPFFFHQLSGDHMEIRSAGPDLRMWTRDDIVRK